MSVVLMPRMQTSRAYEFTGVNPPSFPSIPQHENAALYQWLMPRSGGVVYIVYTTSESEITFS